MPHLHPLPFPIPPHRSSHCSPRFLSLSTPFLCFSSLRWPGVRLIEFQLFGDLGGIKYPEVEEEVPSECRGYSQSRRFSTTAAGNPFAWLFFSVLSCKVCTGGSHSFLRFLVGRRGGIVEAEDVHCC